MNSNLRTVQIAAAVALCLWAAHSTQAAPFYWSDLGGVPVNTDTIRRANGDGSGIQTVVSGLEEPRGIALDLVDSQIYWADPGASAIMCAALDGSGPVQTVASAGDATAGVALDVASGKVYWTDSDGYQINHGGFSGEIRRANLDGSDVETLVTGLVHPSGIAVDPVGGQVYWTELDHQSDGLGSIQRANLDGSNVQTLVTGIDEANNLAIDIEDGKLFWPELTTHTIQSANLDGSGVQVVLTGLDNPTSISLSLAEGKLYWTDSLGGPQPNQIDRANFDGSDPEVLVSGAGIPWGIAVVPEPPSIVLLGVAGVALLVLGRRRGKGNADPGSRCPSEVDDRHAVLGAFGPEKTRARELDTARHRVSHR